ncbi:MAG: biotin transporter BioY [Chloroflexota bacterium]
MTIALPRLDRSTADQRGITIADFLVPIRLGERVSSRVRHVALILAGVVVVSLCAQIYIPTQPVPFTGQTFGVLLVGGALGFRRGAAALAIYVLIGLLGLPVFAEAKHGSQVLLGPTGGYLVGFVVAAALVGRLAELGWDRKIGGAFGAMLLGNAVIYVIGIPWLMAVTGMSSSQAVAVGLTPFLAWDFIKLALAAAVFPFAWWVVGRRPGER